MDRHTRCTAFELWADQGTWGMTLTFHYTPFIKYDSFFICKYYLS